MTVQEKQPIADSLQFNSEATRNEPAFGESVRRVAEELNGGLSPATELYLQEVTSIYSGAADSEIALINEGLNFSPDGIYTAESLNNLEKLLRHTSKGSSIWVLQPGISLDSIQAGHMRIAGQGGKEMLNWLSAASSLNLGGQHPDIETADAWAGLRFGSNNCSAYHPMGIEDEAKERLVNATPGNEKRFVVWESTGGGANTVAIEAAILHQKKRGRQTRKYIVAFEKAYHGNNGLAAMATDFGIRTKQEVVFGKVPTIILPFPDNQESTDYFLSVYSEMVKKKNQIAGILLEAIQGDGGMRVMTQEAANYIVETSEQYDLLSIWDEVQSGMGRSGKFTAVEWFGERVSNSCNNAFIYAKALANGYPISAAVLPKSYDDFDTAGALTTMMGNASGLVRMMTAIDIINRPDFLKAVELKGELLKSIINSVAAASNHLEGARGKGLMAGAVFTNTDGSSAVTPAICYLGGCGILAGGVENNSLRLHPRLTVEPEVVQAVAYKVVETSILMDNDQLPQEVYQMEAAGKSGLDH